MSKPATPMMLQYREVKTKLAAGTLLLFRLGDFFELFEDDARMASNILGLTLTARGEVPMAGIPAHAVDSYIRRLLEAGRKVAVCDQLEEATPGKLVKRALTRVYTPGTTLSDEHLRQNHNQYLLAIDQVGAHFCASYLELSTGQWVALASQKREDFLTHLVFLGPAELVVPESKLQAGLKEYLIENLPDLTVTELPESFFEPLGAYRILCEALGVLSLKGFGLSPEHPAIGSAGAIYSYASQALCGKPGNLKNIEVATLSDQLIVDPATARQLELFAALGGGRKGSLQEAIDSTLTAGGGRLLERVMLSPSLDLAELNARQNAVEVLSRDPQKLDELRATLKSSRDIERILSRLQNRLRSPRELTATRDTLRALPAIKSFLQNFSSGSAQAFAFFASGLGAHTDLAQLLGEALEEEAIGDISEGGYIRAGYDARLDELKALSANHKTWLAEFERVEQERTGIKSLKVRYNQNFGFFIEITKANLARVPADYIRKSTTVSGERYVTAQLLERQKEILSAETNAIRRELEIFETLLAAVLAQADALRSTAQALAWTDLLAAFAWNARRFGYVRPQLNDGKALEIELGRHAVVEQSLEAMGQKFVPNSTALSTESEQLLIITGPNMAGKSTYIRQVALIVYLAQIGSFVPAASAKIGLVDRLFSRIGSSDALHRGESTFMVEMTETAYILRHATARSLIILDEIGRGTSTYDGLSIAWAVAEYLHSHPSEGPRTLFATHYHELTRLEKTLPRLRNYTVAVREHAGKIIFVRQVVPGTADRSYGVHVAELAGMPKEVVDRAKKLLEGLEAQAKAPKAKGEKRDEAQLGLF